MTQSNDQAFTGKVLPDYQKWRDLIFSVTGEQVGVSGNQPGQVYGVVMDVGLADDHGNPVEANAVISETAFASGESSLRTSFGRGIVGLGGMEKVAQQAQLIVAAARRIASLTAPADNHDLPVSGKVYFYFLTTSGVRFFQCGFKEINSRQHPFAEIFARFSWIKNQADNLVHK